jgi:protein O-mannosyl-transferase
MAKKIVADVAPALPGKYLSWVLAGIACLIYANTLSHGFVLDDIAVIGQNKFVHEGLSGIPKLLTTFYWQGYWEQNSGIYRPLSMIMFAVEWQIMPGNPFIHHLIQVLLYGLVVWQLYKFLSLILTKYSIWLPLAATLLFALHPIHTEVVANIKSRDEILCFLFFLLTAKELVQKQKITIAAIIYYALCLLSKEAGILYLPVFLLLLVQMGEMKLAQAVKTLLPLFITVAVWLGWHYFVTHNLSPVRIPYTRADNSLFGCPDAASRLATGFVILGMYIAKSVWPYSMSYDYSFNQIPCESGFSMSAVLVLAICIALLYLAYKYFKKNPPVSFGILFFFCTILFASNIIYLIGSTMGDRLLFAPVLGSVICICWAAYKLTGQLASRQMFNTGALIILGAALVFSAKTIARNGDWRSNETLFTADKENAPGSARVLYNYATTLLGQYDKSTIKNKEELASAVQLFNESVTIDTAYWDAWVNLSAAQYKSAHYAEAFAATQKALQLNPRDSSVLLTIGDCFFMTKQYDQAIDIYRKSLQRGEYKTRTYNFLGTSLFSQQKYDEAIVVFREGLSRDTTDAEMWGNYGNALGVTNHLDEALYAFQKSLQIKPNQKNTLYFMSLTYRNKGDIANADEYLRRSQMQ